MIYAALQHLLVEANIDWQLHALVFHHVPETSRRAQDFSYLRMTGDTEPQFPAISEFLVENPKLLKLLTVSYVSVGATIQFFSVSVSVPETYSSSINQY